MEITVETHELRIIRYRGGRSRMFCPLCQSTATVLTCDETARVLQVTIDEIYALVARGNVHLIETVDRPYALICCRSLDSKTNFNQRGNKDAQ